MRRAEHGSDGAVLSAPAISQPLAFGCKTYHARGHPLHFTLKCSTHLTRTQPCSIASARAHKPTTQDEKCRCNPIHMAYRGVSVFSFLSASLLTRPQIKK